MIRAFTAGMASITCYDPLATTLQSLLKHSFSNQLRATSNVLGAQQLTPEQASF